MTDFQYDAGNRLEECRLPRMVVLKQRVNRGDKVSELDLDFLKLALEEGRHIESLVATHPGYRILASRRVSLYDEITRKALENEQHS